MIIVLFAVPMINDKRDSSRSISQTFFLATGNYSSTIPQPLAGNLIKFTGYSSDSLKSFAVPIMELPII